MNAPSLAWFARHEARLAWREATWWLRGRQRRLIRATLAILFVFAMLHGGAYLVVAPFIAMADRPDKTALLILSTLLLSSWTLMLSQALETVTRALYARGDADLILSSPVRPEGLFAVRLVAAAGASTLTALLLTAPFVHVMAYAGGPRWLAAYGVLAAMGASATACAILTALALFRVIGPARARLFAQIVAAIVGAGVVIALQVAAVLGHEGLARFAILRQPRVIAAMPEPESLVWLPVRAVFGEPLPLTVWLLGAALLLFAAVAWASKDFAGHMLTAAGAAHKSVSAARRSRFRARDPGSALRRKELKLLIRDPWLLSQTLMQLLYLIPPALLAWRSFGENSDVASLIAPVLVMAAGQLAGGLAWLAVSGEDAPDLIATAPVSPHAIVRAKLEAVVIALALPMLPLVLALALLSPAAALAAFIGSVCAGCASATIQFLFRAPARRAAFRRRQTASRVATFAEAFSSIAFAGAAGLAAAESFLAIPAALGALAVLVTAWSLAPRRD